MGISNSAFGKGDRGKATRLHSLIVRNRGWCERCGSRENLQTAHIIRRVYSATRTDLANAWCLCAKCHFRLDQHADEFMVFVDGSIGREAFEHLKRKAETPTKVDWASEVLRLRSIASDLGIAS